ncbi:MAG: hypothetical protein MUC69_00820 [Gemmatimonadales bacterium]|nr:hypothetical protein [Gemmatimonadales bacterium]
MIESQQLRRSTRAALTSLCCAGLTLLWGCGDDGPDGGGPALGCEGGPLVSLAPGAATILDLAQTGCLRLPAAAAGSEHLVAVLSTAGAQLSFGVAAPYRLLADASPAALRMPERRALAAPDRGAEFHAMLRGRERDAARRRSWAPPPRARLRVPPAVGERRRFSVCADLGCSGVVPVDAVARVVGRHAAIYLDESVPPGGLVQADLDTLGLLFDDELYPIDTTAFGRESDIDGNGVVIILLTDAVNQLIPGCADGYVLGYFVGLDLLPSEPGSNAGEVFYSRVPDPSLPACEASRDQVVRFMLPTFIHEFQHMISFNQHVLLRAGDVEHVWLNEALSHFAEELGSRLVTGPGALGNAANRETQFVGANINNAFDYLADPESHFLVLPGTSFGSLPERGAGWLFVRWLADHYGDGSVPATTLTRALVATTARGAANVEAAAGVGFPELVSHWQLANYLDDLPGFTAAEPRLAYRSVNLRRTFANLFPVYPLRPDSVGAQGLDRTGTLRAGSGRHVRVVQPAGGGEAVVDLAAPDGTPINALAAARVAVTRIR